MVVAVADWARGRAHTLRRYGDIPIATNNSEKVVCSIVMFVGGSVYAIITGMLVGSVGHNV